MVEQAPVKGKVAGSSPAMPVHQGGEMKWKRKRKGTGTLLKGGEYKKC